MWGAARLGGNMRGSPGSRATRPTAAVPSALRPTGRYREQYGVIIICRDERDQQRIYAAMRRAGYTCKVVTT